MARQYMDFLRYLVFIVRGSRPKPFLKDVDTGERLLGIYIFLPGDLGARIECFADYS